MFGLTVPTTAIILAAALAVLGLAYLLLGWLRKRSWRVMLRGLGFVLMPLALLSMGLMDLLIDGINAIVNWALTTVRTGWITFGLVIGGIGLAAYLIGSFIPPVGGDEAARRRQEISHRRLEALKAGAAGYIPRGPSPEKTAPLPQVAGGEAEMSAEDKEVDEILSRHGIN